ncbi:ABC transporter substrate-binding protein [Rhizobium bangladeshense]|uniref:ABC transporter substrate-binding protein n=1 Tax=Rhizobium bangladeshense TaxID=1138189 RepID=A0ABS7LLK8_9HYPH|nr:ABC transporter substrate-binding protein [Rhizobium bangladeshense]MBY3592367.1 ABC transporter substrate-binding protein [Rhizobium bangladeshense]
MTLFKRAAIAAALMVVAGHAAADEVKVGVIGQFSGPYALAGKQLKESIDVFVAQHGTKAGSHDIEFVYKDIGGSNPALAKSLAEQLIVKDKVSILTGFFLSPEAAAVAPVINETKTPSVLSVSSAPQLLRMSPYFVRAGENIWQPAYAQADFAIDSGKKRAYIAIADYAPGHEVQEAFARRFKEKGGEIVGEDRMPLSTVDFAAFAERIANASPDVVVTFLPNGAPSVAFFNALTARGITKSTTVIGIAETDDPDLHLFGPSIIGVYSAIFYSGSLDNPENVAFKKVMAEKFGEDHRVGVNNASPYDAIQLIYKMVEAQGDGDFDPEKAMSSVKGYEWKSPTGPKRIDPTTREMNHNIYIRQVQEVNGKLQNVVVKTYEMVGNPWADAHPE